MTDMLWLALQTSDDIETRLKPALEQVSFNTWSGLMHEDKHKRPLTLVGYRDGPRSRSENVLGITCPRGDFVLQQQVLDALDAVYGARTGQPGHIWLPHKKELNQ